MQPYRNDMGISLSVAAFLATDGYDYEDETISATGLIRPIRQIILAPRVPELERIVDISSLVKSRLGHAIHDSIERTWTEGAFKKAMKLLGYPQKIIDRVVINPEGEVAEGDFPVYLEQRSYKDIEGFTVSGKYDFVADGRLEDFKSTSTYVFENQTSVEKFQLQGSIYRWLNPEIITKDHMAIQYIFTDFMPAKTAMPGYPNKPIEQQLIELMSIPETEHYVRSKLRQIVQFQDTPEPELPRCTDKDLWRKPDTWQYFSNPDNKKATKNFDNQADAETHRATKGKGVVVKKGGEVVACKYCPAFSICTQKNEYIADGSLKV